jgi:archaellum component FlaG (FlaF/FlaG flagellin family)
METAIPALVLAGILVLSAALLADVTGQSVATVGDSWRDIGEIAEERLGTDLTSVSSSVDETGKTIILTVRNDGRTSIEAFDRMDVIVTYEAAGNQVYNAWLPYTEASSQPDNSWKVVSITNDMKNPGILDSGEEIVLQVVVDPAVVGPTNRWLVLATATGLSYTLYF